MILYKAKTISCKREALRRAIAFGEETIIDGVNGPKYHLMTGQLNDILHDLPMLKLIVYDDNALIEKSVHNTIFARMHSFELWSIIRESWFPKKSVV